MIEYCDKNAKDFNVSAPFSIRCISISFSKFINISACHIKKPYDGYNPNAKPTRVSKIIFR